MVSAIVLNEHYTSEEEFLAALGDALRVEYKAIVDAGFLLQLDCPDLAREKHNTYADRPLEDFIAFGNRVVDAINAAIHDIPPERVRLHVCWGNYEGPHDLESNSRRSSRSRTRQGRRLRAAVRQSAPRARVSLSERSLGKDQIIVAGVINSTTNFVEHPEVIAERLENVASRNRRSASRDGGQRLRLRDHRGPRARRRGRGVGEVQIDGGGRKARVVAAVLDGVKLRPAACRRGSQEEQSHGRKRMSIGLAIQRAR